MSRGLCTFCHSTPTQSPRSWPFHSDIARANINGTATPTINARQYSFPGVPGREDAAPVNVETGAGSVPEALLEVEPETVPEDVGLPGVAVPVVT